MKMLKPQRRPKSKRLLLSVVALVIVAGVIAFAVISQQRHNNNTPNANQPPANTGGAPFNTSPATKEEQQQADQRKQEINQPPAPTPNSSSGQKKQVSVVITEATPNTINAYVSDVLEDGGTCTATLTSGSQTVTRTSQGFANVRTTNCQPITPSFPSAGKWTVTVKYSSATAEGQAQTTVDVP